MPFRSTQTLLRSIKCNPNGVTLMKDVMQIHPDVVTLAKDLVLIHDDMVK
jgi:hypothetical protein